MPEPRWSVTAIVPVYNEIELVERSLPAIDDFLAGLVPDHEVLVVESGSTDGSGAACDRLASERPRIRIVHEGARRGFGSAIRTGFAAATKELVWIVPADVPFPLEVLRDALDRLDGADCVLSYRVDERRSLPRAVMSVVYNGLARAVLGLPVRSVNSAFKLYKRRALEGCALRSSGWFIDAEVLVCLQRRGARWVEIPVPLIERTAGRSTVGAVDPLKVLIEMVRFRMRS